MKNDEDFNNKIKDNNIKWFFFIINLIVILFAAYHNPGRSNTRSLICSEYIDKLGRSLIESEVHCANLGVFTLCNNGITLFIGIFDGIFNFYGMIFITFILLFLFYGYILEFTFKLFSKKDED
jgi:hypothetical protein